MGEQRRFDAHILSIHQRIWKLQISNLLVLATDRFDICESDFVKTIFCYLITEKLILISDFPITLRKENYNLNPHSPKIPHPKSKHILKSTFIA